jgi:hypothetical protein
MSGAARALIAALVVLAIGAVPTAVQWCAIACETTRPAATAAAAPACHHAAPAGAQIGHASEPCGNDHHAIVVTSVANRPDVPSTGNPLAARTTADAASFQPPTALGERARQLRPRPPEIPLALSASLRI